MRRWWIVVILVAILGLAGWALRAGKGVPVDTAVVRKGTIRAYVEERAKTRLPDIYAVTMPLQGRILPIELTEGERVSKGQVVAHMDTADLKTDLTEAANTVERYDKNLEQVELAVQQAEQTVLASKSKYEFAEREFGRKTELFRKGSASESEQQQAEMEMIESRVELRKNELQKSMYQIGKHILSLMRETEVSNQTKIERDLRRTVIESPVDGVVLEREESNERVLQAGEVLMHIGDLSKLEVEADVLTQDAATIALQDPVEIEAPALGDDSIQGYVSRIFPQGFTKVSSLGVEQQRVKVIIDFVEGELERIQAEDRQLGVDYRLRVRVYTDARQGVLIAPRAALIRGPDGSWQTYVVQSGVAQLRPVRIGIRNDYEAEILEGLEEGDRVILAPDSSLEAGQPVAEEIGDVPPPQRPAVDD
jgi:HlyD family secretion protein